MIDDTAESLFPTQRQVEASPLLAVDIENGAPYAPLPKSFLSVPARLDICVGLASDSELRKIVNLRRDFNIGSYQPPYVRDVARAFRLLAGCKTYLEIGTFDRGNLAYVSSLLDDEAIIIGLDVVGEPTRDALLRSKLKPGQTYLPIVGNSRTEEAYWQVKKALGDRELDAVFIDGDHTAYGVMSDYARYEGLVHSSGVILFHDSVWEGTSGYKGSADAISEIDKLDPVYLVDGDNPPRRFLRPMFRNEFWGVVGVVFASDQLWRRAA